MDSKSVKAAEKAVTDAEKARPDESIEDIEEFKESERARKQAIADARAELEAWQRIAHEPERRRMEAEREAEARAAEAERQRAEAERQRIEAERRAAEVADTRKSLDGEPRVSTEERTENEPKPIGMGVFGKIYDAFKGKAMEALQFLSSKKEGQAKGVFHRDGIGDIDLVWGYAPNPFNGKGLAHIDKKHVQHLGDFESLEDAVKIIEDVVNNGEIKEGEFNSVAIEKDKYRVVVVKDESGNWILTAFDYTTSAKEKKEGKTLPP